MHIFAAVQAKLIAPVNGESETTISSEVLLMNEEFPKMSIQIPFGLMTLMAMMVWSGLCLTCTTMWRVCFQVASQETMSEQIHFQSLYYHVSCNSSVLASGVVSTALQCGTGRCLTDNLTLSNPVLVTIQHSMV